MGQWRVWAWAWVPFQVASPLPCLKQSQHREQRRGVWRAGPSHWGRGRRPEVALGGASMPGLSEASTQQGLEAGREPCTPPRKKDSPTPP